MEPRDWSSTEFIGAAVAIVAVWTAGFSSGADKTWTVVATTGLAIVYVLAKGFQNRQTGKSAWSRTELYVAAAQVFAVAATAADSKAPLSTALVAIGLTIATYIVSYVLSRAHILGSASDGSSGAVGSLDMALLPYDVPRATSTAVSRGKETGGPIGSSGSSVRTEHAIRFTGRSDGSSSSSSWSFSTTSHSGGNVSPSLTRPISGEQVLQFMEADNGAPLPNHQEVLNSVHSGRQFAVQTWHAERDELTITRIQRESNAEEATLLTETGEVAAVIKASPSNGAEDLRIFELFAQYEIPLRVRRTSPRGAVLQAENVP